MTVITLGLSRTVYAHRDELYQQLRALICSLLSRRIKEMTQSALPAGQVLTMHASTLSSQMTFQALCLITFIDIHEEAEYVALRLSTISKSK